MTWFQPRRIHPFEAFHPFPPSWVFPASVSVAYHEGPGPVHHMAVPSPVSAKKHQHVDTEEVCGQFVQSLDHSQRRCGVRCLRPVVHTRNPCPIHCHFRRLFCFDLCVGCEEVQYGTLPIHRTEKVQKSMCCHTHLDTLWVHRHNANELYVGRAAQRTVSHLKPGSPSRSFQLPARPSCTLCPRQATPGTMLPRCGDTRSSSRGLDETEIESDDRWRRFRTF